MFDVQLLAGAIKDVVARRDLLALGPFFLLV